MKKNIKTMILELDVQRVFTTQEIPEDEQFKTWTKTALIAGGREENSQLAIRIVDEEEGQKLNEQWRHKKGPTNVLSFSMSGLDLIAPELLGDIVICAPIIKKEAQEQSKTLQSHWAHMVIHGVLHLLGYDHSIDSEAEKMEMLEIKIMAELGYSDPYQPAA
ncbi:MAG: rRNA maturation RNase YbeY [Gammaproteobacteria bacterium]